METLEALGTNWSYLTSGAHSDALISRDYPDKVLVVSFKTDEAKRLLSTLKRKIKHVPFVEQTLSLASLDLTNRVAYLMPRYKTVGWNGVFSGGNEVQYGILGKLGKNILSGDWNKDAMPFDFMGDENFWRLDQSVQDGLLEIFALVEDTLLKDHTLTFFFDIKRANVAEDENGDLILLDVIYIYPGREGRGARK